MGQADSKHSWQSSHEIFEQGISFQPYIPMKALKRARKKYRNRRKAMAFFINTLILSPKSSRISFERKLLSQIFL